MIRHECTPKDSGGFRHSGLHTGSDGLVRIGLQGRFNQAKRDTGPVGMTGVPSDSLIHMNPRFRTVRLSRKGIFGRLIARHRRRRRVAFNHSTSRTRPIGTLQTLALVTQKTASNLSSAVRFG